MTGCSSKSRRHCGRNVLFEVLRNTSDSGLFTCWGSLPAGAMDQMQVRITVTELSDGTFDLLTARGHRVGARLLNVAPKDGEQFPEIPAATFMAKHEAYAAAMAWNLYLKFAWEHRSKSHDRGRE